MDVYLTCNYTADRCPLVSPTSCQALPSDTVQPGSEALFVWYARTLWVENCVTRWNTSSPMKPQLASRGNKSTQRSPYKVLSKVHPISLSIVSVSLSDIKMSTNISLIHFSVVQNCFIWKVNCNILLKETSRNFSFSFLVFTFVGPSWEKYNIKYNSLYSNQQ